MIIHDIVRYVIEGVNKSLFVIRDKHIAMLQYVFC